jgi:membrane-associated protein
MKYVLDFIFHIDKNLALAIDYLGFMSYCLLFLIIFLETGIVITPFLPGDSLIFAAGTLAAQGSFNPLVLWFVLVAGAILGDTVNYWIGHYIGPKAFNENATIKIFNLKIKVNRILKEEYLVKAERFYEKYGGKAIILARFIPIIRTFAPFAAGIGKMNYNKFISYNIIGGIIWVTIFLLAGYYFGTIPFVQKNFHYTILIILIISIVPVIYEWWKARN